MIQRVLVPCAAVLLAFAVVPEALAATTLKFHFNQAVSICQPALPAYDGLIRKRPKAVANEGTTTAFVSCALAHQSEFFNTVEGVRVVVINRQDTAVEMTCTLVDGSGDITFSPSKARTITVPSGGRAVLPWSYASNNGGVRYTAPAVSCALPPSTEIVGVAYEALDEIGA